ncbi:hypothetical protein [Pseudomonas fragi]|uniref:hypothetical protein n=1 Tax=Pseudomonas fragi TaxID=296 RepID=UPI0014758924|nr:hypothetical protein [Pseudomonas fragi]NNB55725.1 hypothetical protein [Pseudomonas fragi]
MEIVLRKYELLKEISNSRSCKEFSLSFLPALRSQATFAAFSLPEMILHPISLNNLKNTANEIIDGGFDYFDAMRKNAVIKLLAPIEPLEPPRSDTKAELITQVRSLKRQLTQIREHNMRLTYIIREIQSRYQTLATLPPNVIKERHALDINEVFAMLAGMGIVLES